MRTINVNYHKPARFNDLLQVTARVTEFKKASMLFEQNVVRQSDQQLLCDGSVRIACLKADSFKPCAIPQVILEASRVD